ncbi:Cleavage polyadenylation factor subunit clp1 [Coemansia sp. RSA 1813]|nr:Cleavage polyadenylation factor subunit clp1 [Coemansia sp. RSA 1646]KAJ1766104.1 Cleavage polyadenylation factor subunit clp1 [Coemansia sp. RSA 1843]KAJ2086184.1 Cleavage polyadenylation factor subunit clp1 [Coemansia sp. RSA 986]KAJ2210911.1 Cleavage polyadenylation factor subunit clp1 [Coemansia sp. RSA 487]KAJ2564064.1 Cleavage polyadenylation factor subunit clp1 [Coemansia sp. RSA 1813]
MSRPPLSSAVKEWKVGAGEEFRFEVGFRSRIEIRLTQGQAEYFGAELGPEATYSFSGENGAVYSWSGCTLRVAGDCESAYVGGETPMSSYINVHMALQQMRVAARSEEDNKCGPRVLLVGPEDSGKTSLARILLNYAVRQSETPMYVDLDPRDASVTVPGTLSATPITHTIDIEAGFMGGEPASPLVWQFGHESPAENQALFNQLVDCMAESINRRLDVDAKANAAGLIADTRVGASDAAIEHAVKAFGITTLVVVGNERMYSLFSSRFEASGVSVVKLARSGGTVSRDAMFRQLSSARAIRCYFNGTESEPTMSYPTVAQFDDITVLRVGEDAVAPSSSLPLGETRKLSETTVFEVTCDEALTHSVLAVTDATPPADTDSERAGIVGAQALGFVNVTRVDMDKRRLMLVAPVRGQLPRRVLLYGSIKWMETL